jgi:hypothetical protein
MRVDQGPKRSGRRSKVQTQFATARLVAVEGRGVDKMDKPNTSTMACWSSRRPRGPGGWPGRSFHHKGTSRTRPITWAFHVQRGLGWVFNTSAGAPVALASSRFAHEDIDGTIGGLRWRQWSWAPGSTIHWGMPEWVFVGAGVVLKSIMGGYRIIPWRAAARSMAFRPIVGGRFMWGRLGLPTIGNQDYWQATSREDCMGYRRLVRTGKSWEETLRLQT